MLRLSSMVRFTMVTAVAAVVVAACGGSSGGNTSVDVGKGSLTGAGATFPGPFYNKAFANYSIRYPQVTVNYQPVGSGAGIKQFQAKTVDFGASDVPMTSAEVDGAGGAAALTEIPTTLGVISVAFNVSGASELKLDGDTLAGIFMGTIKNWNDPKIAALNSGATFPNKAITVVHRSDGSGTTYHFTDYLAKISSDWKTKTKSPAKSISWPTGTGASGNQAVAQAITSTDGAIGYVELAYVVQTGMKQAAIKNSKGKFVKATVEGATAAAATKPNVTPTDFSITDASCDDCYPIAAFSWIILFADYSDADKGKAVVNLFKWLVTDGQTDGRDLQYAPLPKGVRDLALNNLKQIKAGGATVLK